ncbi:MAG: zinc-binding dehydrogenase [Deltaproteobacteria bacterium]|nr:zinc-binding dehydrogenase [Deltaproteobacteria bacterium]
MKGKVGYIPQARQIEFYEYEVPDVEPGAILAQVTRTNVCGSEVHMWRGEFGKRGVMPGHEMVGRIYKLGKGVTTDTAGQPLKEGDRIAPVYYRTCGLCVNCREGNAAACVTMGIRARRLVPQDPPHFHATFATHYYIHPGQYVYKVPDNVPDHAASSANCALSEVFFGLDRANLRYEETLLVQGAGGLGLHAMAVAKARGARVIAIDGVDLRLKRTKAFGADDLIDMRAYPTMEARIGRVRELTNGLGPDVVLEVAGVPDAFLEAINLVRNGGRVIEIGNISMGLTVAVPPAVITFKSISVIGVATYNPHYLHKALRFLSEHIDQYPYHELVDAEFPLDHAAEAMDKSDRKEITRAALVP